MKKCRTIVFSYRETPGFDVGSSVGRQHRDLAAKIWSILRLITCIKRNDTCSVTATDFAAWYHDEQMTKNI